MAKKPLDIETLRHDHATRRNIPTAEYESVMAATDKSPVRLAYERRNRDLDPQLVWRGKDGCGSSTHRNFLVLAYPQLGEIRLLDV